MTPKELRKSLGFTVAEMAKRLGRSASTISMVENGKRNPSFSLLKDYEKVSDGKVTLSDFNQKQ